MFTLILYIDCIDSICLIFSIIAKSIRTAQMDIHFSCVQFHFTTTYRYISIHPTDIHTHAQSQSHTSPKHVRMSFEFKARPPNCEWNL